MITITSDSSKFLVRYPFLECPNEINVDVTFSLLVHFRIKSPQSDITYIALKDQSFPDKLPEVEIVVSALGFDIKDTNTKYREIGRDKDCIERFILTPRELGMKQIIVNFYQDGEHIDTKYCSVFVTKGCNICEPKKPYFSRPLRIISEPERSPPDLEICILQYDNKLRFLLYTTQEFNLKDRPNKKIGYNHICVGETYLDESLEEKIQTYFKELSQMACNPDPDKERRMKRIGNNLWDELIPEKLKLEYWQFKDHVKSLLLTSDEPWIPWEIIRPYRNNDATGEREEDPFWCQKFDFSRWLSGKAAACVLPDGKAQPVAPANIAMGSALDNEVKFIEELSSLHSGIKSMPHVNNISEVLTFMEKEAFTLIHFATHGEFDTVLPNNSKIELCGGCLMPSDLSIIYFDSNRQRPLVFINSCNGAQMGFSFTNRGGWAECLVNKVGVGAFASAMWEVETSLAFEFIKSFYTEFLKNNQTIAQAFRKARDVVREANPGNSTWLAYVLYADPEALYIGDQTMS